MVYFLALLSKTLATIDCNCGVDTNLENMTFSSVKKLEGNDFEAFLQRAEFIYEKSKNKIRSSCFMYVFFYQRTGENK